MTAKTKRRVCDWIISLTLMKTMNLLTGKWWACFLMLPYGLWSFYDGMTRHEL